MERQLINIDVGGKKDKPPESLSFTLNPQGYDNLVTKDDLAKHIEEVKRYVREEIGKIPKCTCER